MENLPISKTKSFWNIICACKIDFGWVAMFSTVAKLKNNYRYGNCNYILFTRLPWPGDSEGTFWSSSQAGIYPPVYHTRRSLHTVPLIAERQAEKL